MVVPGKKRKKGGRHTPPKKRGGSSDESQPGSLPGAPRVFPSVVRYSPSVERKKTITVPGLGQTEVTEVGFRASGEHWNEYLVDDGTVLRVKLVATEVLRIDGQFDEEGNPAYIVKSTNVMNVSASDEKRGK